jgi:AcrR family transcriptional regulator
VLKDGVFKMTEMKAPPAMIRDEMSERIIEAAQSIVTCAGAGALTVREILKRLNITNRVFYNRFHNIGEVLAIVYRNMVLKVRESISANVEGKDKDEFFEYVNEILTSLLTISYDTKKQFNQYVFDIDSINRSNFEWWFAEIKKLIEYAKSQDFIKDVDTDVMSYSIWCFCRGYNADAVGRNVPREIAIKNFKYSFSVLLDGMKK